MRRPKLMLLAVFAVATLVFLAWFGRIDPSASGLEADVDSGRGGGVPGVEPIRPAEADSDGPQGGHSRLAVPAPLDNLEEDELGGLREQDVRRIVDKIEQLRAEGSRSQNDYRPLLRELGRLNTEESIGLLVDYMEDPEFDFSHRLSIFASALRDADDPRVYPAARRLLEEQLALGETSWSEVDGYYQLVASKGGSEGAGFFLEQLESPDPQVVACAWRNVGHVVDQSRWREFLDAALAMAATDPDALKGLAAWGNEGVTDELSRLLSEEEASETVRQSAFDVVSQTIGVEGLSDFESHYWRPLNSSSRQMCLRSLRGLAENGRLALDVVVASAQPILADALLGSDRDVQLEAARVICDYPALGASDSIIDALTRLTGDAVPASSQTKQLKRALAEATRQLGSTDH